MQEINLFSIFNKYLKIKLKYFSFKKMKSKAPEAGSPEYKQILSNISSLKLPNLPKEERNFTKNKDADRIILQNLDDKDLFRTLLMNKYTNSLVDENFWMNRLLSRFPQVSKYKEQNITWRKFYLSLVYYINKMMTEFGFTFTQGNPKKYYEALKVNARRLSRKRQAEFLRNDMEDAALFSANKMNEFFHHARFYILNTPEWEQEKADILETFPQE
jgi:hypothetical protein